MSLDTALAGAATSVLNALGRDMWIRRLNSSKLNTTTLEAETAKKAEKVRGSVIDNVKAKGGLGVVRGAASVGGRAGRSSGKVPGVKVIINTAASFEPLPGHELRISPAGQWLKIHNVEPITGQGGALAYQLFAES